MNDKRLTPEEREQLAADLKQKLSRQRIRRGRWALAGLAMVAVALLALRLASRTPPPLPPVTLVCFDTLILDDRAMVHSQLIAPGHPDAPLGQLEIHWKITGVGINEASTTSTAPDGKTRLELGVRQPGAVFSALASFVDPQGEFRRDDRAQAVSPTDAPIQVVGIEELIAAPVDWLSGSLDTMKPVDVGKLDRAKQTIYCAGSVDPIVYRAMRNWLRHHASSDLPIGPLLREPADGAAKRLAERRPDNSVTRPLHTPR